jgi:hypothetical protein
MNPQKQLTQLCEKYSLNSLYTFGSHGQDAARFILTGETMPVDKGDLDVGILPRDSLSVKEKVQLALALEMLFKVSRVDLVVLPDADPFLAANIIRGERLYARDSYLADEYDLYVLRRAGDLAPLERERMALILEKSS